MDSGKTMLAQLIDVCPPAYDSRFRLQPYQSDPKIKTVPHREQVPTLVFARLAGRACLNSQKKIVGEGNET